MQFLAELKELAGTKPITCKLVLMNEDMYKIRSERNRRQPDERSKEQALEDLRVRLKKFKLAKKPTVDTIHDFINETKRKVLKVVQFDGRSWNTIPEKTWDSDKIDPLALLEGKPFKLRYTTQDPGEYDSIYITYKFDPKTNMIMPVHAEWNDKKADLKSNED